MEMSEKVGKKKGEQKGIGGDRRVEAEVISSGQHGM